MAEPKRLWGEGDGWNALTGRIWELRDSIPRAFLENSGREARWFVPTVARRLGLVRRGGGLRSGAGVTGWDKTYRRPPWPHLGHK